MPSKFEEILAKKRQELQVAETPAPPVYPVQELLRNMIAENNEQYQQVVLASQNEDLIEALDALRRHYNAHIGQGYRLAKEPGHVGVRVELHHPEFSGDEHFVLYSWELEAENGYAGIEKRANADYYLRQPPSYTDTEGNWRSLRDDPWGWLSINLAIGHMDHNAVYGACVTIRWNPRLLAVELRYRDQAIHPKVLRFLSLDDLLEQIARAVAAEPVPFCIYMAERKGENKRWGNYRSENKAAIEIYDTLAEANGTRSFPHRSPIDYSNRKRYEAIIKLINAEIARANMIRQMAQNTGQIADNTRALVGLGRVSSHQLAQQGLQLDGISQQIADFAQSLRPKGHYTIS